MDFDRFMLLHLQSVTCFKIFDRLQTMFVTDFAIGFATSDRLKNY